MHIVLCSSQIDHLHQSQINSLLCTLLQVSTLYNILCAVHSLHIHRVVHCDLQPVQFGWFNEQQQWKLLGLATWSHTGSARSGNMSYTLRYAAPEVTPTNCTLNLYSCLFDCAGCMHLQQHHQQVVHAVHKFPASFPYTL
jgi:hypothetical protein